MKQRILVTGATGTQGGAVLQALLDLHDESIEVIGLTRNPSSPRAQGLLKRHQGLKLIGGDYDNPNAIFAACDERIDKVFLVQTPPGFPPNADVEEKQGKALIDAAIEHGVKVFVQTTIDRGPQSDTNPTEVLHFISKFRIEKHLIQRAQERQDEMSFTILRPAVFMENFSGGFMTKVLAASLRDGLPSDYPIQLVAAKDIGWFGAQALVMSDQARYHNKSISLAGDKLSYEGMRRVYEEVCGEELPTTYSMVSWALSLLVEGLSKTLQSFKVDGFSADVTELRAVHPELSTFRSWLMERKSTSG